MYQGFWIYENKKFNSLIEFQEIIENDLTLDKKKFLYQEYLYLKSLLKNLNNINLKSIAKLDIRISIFFKKYIKHHINGDIDWIRFKKRLKKLKDSNISAEWVTENFSYDIKNIILDLKNLKFFIKKTTPHNFNYNLLFKKIKEFQKIKKNGGWKKIYKNSSNNILLKRLKISGDYKCIKDENRYGKCLTDSIKNFQIRHSLKTTGKINKKTLSSLNIPIEKKIDKIRLNLNRIKTFPRFKNLEYLIVNLPSFRLNLYKNNRSVFNTKIIIGNKKNNTPIFNNEISYIIMNPYWLIPQNIMKKEISKKILENPNYLLEKGYEARLKFNKVSNTLNLKDINWTKVILDKTLDDYNFAQPPGKDNALGVVKFKFPNRFLVYLHDTPNKYLFKKQVRNFSHGCVRVEHPKRLMDLVLQNNSIVSKPNIDNYFKKGTRQKIDLINKLNVYLVYLTTEIDEKTRNIYFYNDIYNYDKLTY